jgi:hypothetical protein
MTPVRLRADHMSPLTVQVLDTAVAITAPPPIRAALRRSLADLEPAARPDRELALTPSEHGVDLWDAGRVVRAGVAPDLAAATIVWRLNAIAAGSTAHVVVHGACVAGTGGAGVLLVGGSGAGKSTLAGACVDAGLAYLSDELAAIDPRTGRLAPYAKPIGLAGERLVPASARGTVATSATPAAVVFPRYEPGARAEVVRLDHGWALAALAAHATNLAALGGRALVWLAGLASACPAYQLTHGDARRAAAMVERLAADRARPLEPATPIDPVTGATTTVAVGESLAVLHEPTGRVHVLNPGAAAVWRQAVRPSTGGGAWSAAATTVDQLLRLGLLARQQAWPVTRTRPGPRSARRSR